MRSSKAQLLPGSFPSSCALEVRNLRSCVGSAVQVDPDMLRLSSEPVGAYEGNRNESLDLFTGVESLNI